MSRAAPGAPDGGADGGTGGSGTTQREDAVGPSVVVVGDGAAGVLTVTALLERATAAGAPLRVEWVGDGARGRGVAYASTAPWHRLNVPAAAMSVGGGPDDPAGFPRWLAAHGVALPDGDDFVARHDYGSYLLDRLGTAHAAARAAGCAVLREHRGRATALAVDATGVRVTVGGGAGGNPGVDVRAGRAVLATGVPTHMPLPNLTAAAARHPRLVADPWGGRLEEVTGGSVLLVGTGLTMVDTALSLARRLPGVTLRAVSRSGLLPHRHLRDREEPEKPAVRPRPGLTLDEVVAAVEARVAAAPQRWRAVLDGLRPVTQELWRTLSPADRERFLREYEPAWLRHRSRVAPAVAEEVDALRRAGRLRVGSASVEEIDAAGERLRVRLARRGGRTEDVTPDWVVACTGVQFDLRRVADPLVVGLLRDGLGRSHPLGLGLDCAPDGALLTAAGPSDRLHTLGSLRRGDLYETIAVAEIAQQAAELAGTLVARAADRVPAG